MDFTQTWNLGGQLLAASAGGEHSETELSLGSKDHISFWLIMSQKLRSLPIAATSSQQRQGHGQIFGFPMDGISVRVHF